MKSRRMTALMTLIGALAIPVSMAAQENPSPDHKHMHHQYKLIDLGTFGGPNSYFNTVSGRPLNNHGVAAGGADTSVLVSPPYCLFDCYLPRAFRWEDGALTDLGALPVQFPGSGANDINEKGVVTGISFNGGVDLAFGIPYFDAVVWKHGQIIDLGTFGGPLSYANESNDRGQAAGFALNTTPDSFDLGDFCQNFPMPTQMRAFIWQNGVLQDLGTLGGTDSCALYISDHGQATGNSFTNSIVNPVTGLPTLHPFVWDGRRMLDLGTLGGTLATVSAINNQDQVVGLSDLIGDLTFHPFLWSRGKLKDLGTLGGDDGQANAMNDAGGIVGKADLPGSQAHDAFLWEDGVMKDLGRIGGDACSNAHGINSTGQVVGNSSDCFVPAHAFLWEQGGPMMDLNGLIPSNSNVTLTEATFINDRGEITAQGNLSNGDTHAFVLIPDGDCDEDNEARIAASQNNAAPRQHPATMKQGSESLLSPAERIRSMMRQHYHLPGHPAAPRD
jgi:probable HAF family extracellular repeat protein